VPADKDFMSRKLPVMGIVALVVGALAISAASASDNSATPDPSPTECAAVEAGWLPEGSLCVPDVTGSRVVTVGEAKAPCERAPAPEGAVSDSCDVIEEQATSVGTTALVSYRTTDGGEIRVLVAAGGHQTVFGP
jgi:hypothetical protein